MPIIIRKLTGTIGAEVTGLNLSEPLDSDVRAALRQAWLDHKVLVVPKQAELTPEQHIEFTKCFGELEVSASLSSFCLPGRPEVFVLSNEMVNGQSSDTRDVGWQWHTDLTYTTRASYGAVLHARAVPDFGGDTMFANMEVAFDRLSPAYQQMLRGLYAIHDNANSRWYANRNTGSEAAKSFSTKNSPIKQAMVRVHPETGRESLLHSEGYVRRLYGMTEAESLGIISFLTAHSTQPEFVYRHRWSRGDLLIWDNRCTMHKVVADHDSDAAPGSVDKLRLLYRTTLRGVPMGEKVDNLVEA